MSERDELIREGEDDAAGLCTRFDGCWHCRVLALLRAAPPAPEAAAPETHRCCACGHRWEGPLKGAELCGDCWRAAWARKRPAAPPDVAGLVERLGQIGKRLLGSPESIKADRRALRDAIAALTAPATSAPDRIAEARRDGLNIGLRDAAAAALRRADTIRAGLEPVSAVNELRDLATCLRARTDAQDAAPATPAPGGEQ